MKMTAMMRTRVAVVVVVVARDGVGGLLVSLLIVDVGLMDGCLLISGSLISCLF
jgi:hypothetical protein